MTTTSDLPELEQLRDALLAVFAGGAAYVVQAGLSDEMFRQLVDCWAAGLVGPRFEITLKPRELRMRCAADTVTLFVVTWRPTPSGDAAKNGGTRH